MPQCDRISMTSQDVHPEYPGNFFQRLDEGDDALFYAEPRLLVHIDDQAIAAIGGFLHQQLPPNGVILDLMSSWRSHLPEGLPTERVVGLGLNEVEMRENPQLDEWFVHDLNSEPRLPFEPATFDSVIVTVSIQYMTRPVEVFSDVRRVLKEGGVFFVIYSNRMFPTKAVAIWQNLNDSERAQLIASYFARAGGWGQPAVWDISPKSKTPSDPVFVVAASNLKPCSVPQ